MMKSNEILELVRAGFTKEEILSMEGNNEEAGKNSPAADPVPDGPLSGGDKDQKETDPDNSVKEEKKTSSEGSSEDVLLNQIKDLKKEIQALNRDAVDNELPKTQTENCEDAITNFLGGI